MKEGITSVALESRVFEPPKEGFEKAWVRSMDHTSRCTSGPLRTRMDFWGEVAQEFVWFKKWNTVRRYDFKSDPILVRFFEGGKTNITVNCLDRHVQAGKGGKVALIWEPNDPKEAGRKFTYQQLKDEVCAFANVLVAHGIKKGIVSPSTCP